MPIPIASYFPFAQFAEKMGEGLLPEYEGTFLSSLRGTHCLHKEATAHSQALSAVVHIVTSKEAALAELPALCSGDTSAANASGLGTNAKGGAKQVPKAVIFGGGPRLTDADFEEMTKAIQAKAPGVRTVRITRDDLVAAGIPVPPPGATGPPPSGGPPPGNFDPSAMNKILKDKLAGI
jgi:hypothetical protein